MSTPELKQCDETERLVELADRGDASAIDRLFEIHRAYLRRVIGLRLEDGLRGRVDPSDVIQETQLEAARRLREYLANRTVPFRIWLRRTAIEQMITMRRRHILAEKRSVLREVAMPDQSSVVLARKLSQVRPSERLRKEELAQQVRTTLGTMSELDREILVLRHIEELTNQEIAALLQIDAATASQRYGRALKRFRDKLVALGLSASQ